MKLHYAAPSPFVRKVRIAALELGLFDRIKIIDTMVAPGKTDEHYGQSVNPLRKIPALELDDGSVLFDSQLICEYFDSLDGNNTLFPAASDARWQVLSGSAVANGMMDAAVLLRYETFLRPEDKRWDTWVDEQWVKINNGLAWFNQRLPESEISIEGISLACALGYLDFRSPDFEWRREYGRVAMWHDSASARDAYALTAPEG